MRVILTKALIENTQIDLSKVRLSLGDELKINFAENGLYSLHFQVNSGWITRMFDLVNGNYSVTYQIPTVI